PAVGLAVGLRAGQRRRQSGGHGGVVLDERHVGGHRAASGGGGDPLEDERRDRPAANAGAGGLGQGGVDDRPQLLGGDLGVLGDGGHDEDAAALPQRPGGPHHPGRLGRRGH